MNYKNYIFDLYGTLVDIHTDEESPLFWQRMARFFTENGAKYSAVTLRKHYLRNVDIEQRKVREIRVENVFGKLYTRKGVSPDAKLLETTCREFRKLSTEYIRLYPGAKALLQELRAAGKKVYLLSNAQRQFTAPELEMLGIAECFDDILISSDHGVKKPDATFFQILLERHGLRPAECLMVGNDEKCDIRGAQNMGMDTYYIHSNISPAYTGRVKATYAVLDGGDFYEGLRPKGIEI